jgi:hypothetical protein
VSAPRTIHIERKAPAAGRWLDELRRAVGRAAPAELTAADASALTGLPIDEAERGLLRLAAEWPCTLRVSSDGVLLFGFAPPRDRLGAMRRLWRRLQPALSTFADRALAATLMLLGPLLLSALVGNTTALVATAVEHDQKWLWPLVPPAFLLALFFGILAVVGVSAQAVAICGPTLVVAGVAMAWKFAGESDGAGGVLAGLLFGAVFGALGVWIMRKMWRELGEHLVDAAWARRLLGDVRGLLFGPRAPAVDALADERRLVAAIRAQRGVVAPLDLMLLFGWSRAQADGQVARLLVDYGGDIVVDDAGALAYAFDPLLETAKDAPDAPPPEAAVDADCPAPRFFGGSRGFGVVALAMLALGLVGLAAHPDLAVFAGREDLLRHGHGGQDPRWLFQGLGGWLHVAVLSWTGLRAAVWLERLRAWRRLRRRFDLLRAARAGEAVAVDRAPPARLRVEVGAELGLGAGGLPRITFEGHARDRALAGRLREDRGPRRPGRVVFSA